MMVPFDSGMRDTRMGRGPAHLLELGIAKQLETLGLEVEHRVVEPSPEVFPTEIRLSLELQRAVAHQVSDALRRGSFPLVLSGNCNIAVGVLAGIRMARGSSPAVCWFDAHADFNTPETTIGGFLDGMAVSMVTGHCWRALTAQVPGFAPVPESQVLMIGTRDVDPLERERLEASFIRVGAAIADIEGEVDRITKAAGVSEVYLHLDLDTLDASEGRANDYAVAGGLMRSDLFKAIDAIGSRATMRAASITAYDPACDAGERIGRIAIEAAMRIVGATPTRE
ncbi:MAG TPA: arginase family protein [Gemmatimonadaceae bacterium]